MKKSTSILAVAAVVGLSALTATPANATIGAYPNCSAAAAVGVYNIAIGTPGYGPHLDSDSDGIGCENANAASNSSSQSQAQVAQKPVGGAPTGVAQENDSTAGFLALGGLVAAAAAGTVIVRRRVTAQP